jgi:mRNA interferase RelE/StbE
MDYSVFLHPKADKSLRKLPSEDEKRIRENIYELQRNPAEKGERLSGSKYYKLRTGDYRIIYKIVETGKKVIIVFVGHRSKVYDDFERFLG